MNSATERAKRIAEECDATDGQSRISEKCLQFIAAEIEAACEEAEIKAKASYEHELHLAHRIVDGVKALNDHQIEIGQEGFREGFRECQRQAGEIADEHNGCTIKDCWGGKCGATIAERIKGLNP